MPTSQPKTEASLALLHTYTVVISACGMCGSVSYCGGGSRGAGGGGGGGPGANWITVPDGGGRRGVVGPALLRLRALW